MAKAEERSDEVAMLCCAMGRAPLSETSYFLTPPHLCRRSQDGGGGFLTRHVLIPQQLVLPASILFLLLTSAYLADTHIVLEFF